MCTYVFHTHTRYILSCVKLICFLLTWYTYCALDALNHVLFGSFHSSLLLPSPQVKLDEAQELEQEALRKQLTQEQELLDKFQESQKAKLAAQHEREKQALDVKVESTKADLDLEVSALFRGVCVCVWGKGWVWFWLFFFSPSMHFQHKIFC